MTASQGTLLIRGGRVVDPASGLDAVCDLLISGRRVVARGPSLQAPPEAEILDVGGQIVCPGFVDLHTHLRYPGFPAKETITTGANAAAAGGFTTVCAMANTNPVIDNASLLTAVLAVTERDARVHVRQLASVTIGLGGSELTNLSTLAAAGAVAFSDDGKPVMDGAVMRAALEIAASLGKPISVHEEDRLLVGGGVANAGPVARRRGLTEWPCRGEASMVERDVALLAETGGRLHVAHVSCAETVPVLESARSRGLQVTAEVTPHHLRLTDTLLDGDPTRDLPPAHPCAKVNPPLRTQADIEALIAALVDGTIEAIATDHAPHTAEDKAGRFERAAFGFSAIETALPLLLDLEAEGHIDLSTLIERLTVGPARVFGLDAGTVAVGAPADICIFDRDREWVVTPQSLRSKGKNTPLLQSRVRGRVTHTIVDGRIVYRDVSE